MREDDEASGASRPSRWSGRELAICALVATVAAAAGVGATAAVQHVAGASRTASLAAAGLAGELNDQDVYDRVAPGTVDVTSELQYQEETAEGTGIVVDAASGLVLTNNHVIDGASSVTVTQVRSGRSYRAQVVGYDAADDLALLRVPRLAGSAAVRIGDSSEVTTGTAVLAIGNQAGQGGSPTVAPGLISGLGRTVEARDQSSGRTELLHDMLQTSAAIRPGDSGGPLADAAGQVIGIDTAAGSGAGYAIPINLAMAIVRRILAGRPGRGVHLGLPAFLGVLVRDGMSPDPRRQASGQPLLEAQPQPGSRTAGPGSSSRDGPGSSRDRHGNGGAAGSGSGAAGERIGDAGSDGCLSGISDATPAAIAPTRSGALVAGVLCDTPAALAGVSAGDVITSLGGRPVTSPGSLADLLDQNRPGSTLWLDWVTPGGAENAALVTLQAGPAG